VKHARVCGKDNRGHAVWNTGCEGADKDIIIRRQLSRKKKDV